MPKSWAQGSIQGIELVDGDPVRCFIIDGAGLKSQRFVNNRIASDGSVYTQGFNTGGRSARFGLLFPSIPRWMFDALIAAINSSVDSNSTISVSVQDDIQTIEKECRVDGSGWLSYPQQITNEQFVDDVLMRFIST